MKPIKWLRKNNMKVMAVVIIFILFGFIGGDYLMRLSRRKTQLYEVIAHFDGDKEITNSDLTLAGQELEILKALRANDMLKSILMPPFARIPDLRAVFLGELLFSDRTISPGLIAYLKQIIRSNEYRITDEQINAVYRSQMPRSDIYWLLLKDEAEQAGIRMPNEQASKQLGAILPQVYGGAEASQVVSSIMNQHGISEKQIHSVFGKLLAVLEYAKMICSGEDITMQQIMHSVSWENETIDVEFVKLASDAFTEAIAEPNEDQLVEHFNKYKEFLAGAVSEENPYGFGYQLPDSAALEYIAVKLDDVSKIVPVPTQIQTQGHYEKYREQFVVQVPSDPNDPNSQLTEQTRSYAEVAGFISQRLLQQRIDSKAEKIIQEAKTGTEPGSESADSEVQGDVEQLEQEAGSYEITAEQLSEKYKIKVYTGRTGLLSAPDVESDEHLGGLFAIGYGGRNTVRLSQIVFAIDQLGSSELGPFDVPKPTMFENIGPLRDMLRQMVVLVRIIEVKKAAAPETINQTFSRSAIIFKETDASADEKTFSVKEIVANDLKRLAAIDTTREKTDELVRLVAELGWEDAVAKFNELYGDQDKQPSDDPNTPQTEDTPQDVSQTFSLQQRTNLSRFSSLKLSRQAAAFAGNPLSRFLVNRTKRETQLRELLYSLVPPDANSLETVPFVVEFKPHMSYYLIKNLSVKRVEGPQFERIRATQAYTEDVIQSQSLAAVHFNPENIMKRTNFKFIKKDQQQEPNQPQEPEEKP